MISAIFLKKVKRYFYSSFRFFLSNKNQINLIVNSIPKSGTYFLHQILSNVSFIKDYGLFTASRPTLSYKKRNDEKIKNMLNILYKDEFVLGHIEFSEAISNFFNKKKFLHILLIRDPRDIVISESYYLTHSNYFHKLHKYFKKLPNDSERINFAIHGNNYLKNCDLDFPSISKRYSLFIDWTKNSECYILKYEDLISANSEEIIKNLLIFLSKSFSVDINIKNEVNNIKNSLDNDKKPHTFRHGKSGLWKKILNKKQKEWFKREMSDVLKRFNYDL